MDADVRTSGHHFDPDCKKLLYDLKNSTDDKQTAQMSLMFCTNVATASANATFQVSSVKVYFTIFAKQLVRQTKTFGQITTESFAGTGKRNYINKTKCQMIKKKLSNSPVTACLH